MSLDPATQAALDGDVVSLFAAVSIDHPLGTGYLLAGSGVISFNSHIWQGSDPMFGSLAAIDPISDGVGDQAPACKLSLAPPNMAAAVSLCVSGAQGRFVYVYVGTYNPATGLIIGEADLQFFGKIDLVELVPDGDNTAVILTLVSAWEDFFADDEDIRLSNAWHQSVWPGERGLEYMVNILSKMPWATGAPLPPVIRA